MIRFLLLVNQFYFRQVDTVKVDFINLTDPILNIPINPKPHQLVLILVEEDYFFLVKEVFLLWIVTKEFGMHVNAVGDFHLLD